jgi:murein tripeptide amidase MpaA
MKVIAALAVALPLVYAKVSYDGYKSYHVETEGDHEAFWSAIEDLDLDHVSLGCDNHPDVIDIAVAPGSLAAFEALPFNLTVTSEDMGADMALETFEVYESTLSTRAEGAEAAVPPITFFDSYHTWAEHNQFLVDLQAAFPANSALFTVGTSVEGRTIRGIHLWGTARGKKAVVWHGTVHAREWLVAPTVEYLAYQMVLGYQNGDTLIRNTLNTHDFYITPIVNPDGFVYSQTNDRLWRKNRQSRSISSCVGTDINRNWPYQWSGPGSSTNPCAADYRGQSAGDTTENKALVAHTNSVRAIAGLKWFVDWHSYTQLILLPFGYSCTARPANYDRQMSLAAGVAGAIRGVNGLTFTYGPTCETIYQVAGGALDWGHAVALAELSWSFELRPLTASQGGFTVPPSNIVPSGREHWAGVRWLFANW